ncbi:hypothetical protein BJV74DRAFT_109047 [Russula compacta]|nr:hypothetical protein BJV74DRAFT_109047 [Russula compacta]
MQTCIEAWIPGCACVVILLAVIVALTGMTTETVHACSLCISMQIMRSETRFPRSVPLPPSPRSRILHLLLPPWIVSLWSDRLAPRRVNI